MKFACLAFGIICSPCFSSVSFADRILSREEILQIFQELTEQPRKTWVDSGTIEAIHEEYRAAKTTDENEIQQEINKTVEEYQNNPNKRELTEELQADMLAAIPFNIRYKLANEYTMISNVILKYDGERFNWEINVNSRTDSVTLPTNLSENYMTERFNLNWNSGRVFNWDGIKYTIYSSFVNQAIVDITGNTPHSVNGPLTAGVIPWGYGYYTYESISEATSMATEETVDGQTIINITLQNKDGSEILFALDPDKDYAVISCFIRSGGITIEKQYGDFQLMSNGWSPKVIVINKYDALTGKTIASDIWYFTSLMDDVPEIESFNIEYIHGTSIEFNSNLTKNTQVYYYSDTVDTEKLLAERLEYILSENNNTQNCATVALKHVVTNLGKNVTEQQLAQLLNEKNTDTSLFKVKQLAQSLGLYCNAVKTDIQTLKSLRGYEVILHIPVKNHFIVMGDIDNEFVWCVDLTKNQFFYRTDCSMFGMDWSEGTALVISDKPIQLVGNITELSDSFLKNIKGAIGYSCTNLLQEYDVLFCMYVGGSCDSLYEIYFERYGCEAAPSGSCSALILLRKVTSPCIVDPYFQGYCTVLGDWTIYYMRACS